VTSPPLSKAQALGQVFSWSCEVFLTSALAGHQQRHALDDVGLAVLQRAPDQAAFSDISDSLSLIRKSQAAPGGRSFRVDEGSGERVSPRNHLVKERSALALVAAKP